MVVGRQNCWDSRWMYYPSSKVFLGNRKTDLTYWTYPIVSACMWHQSYSLTSLRNPGRCCWWRCRRRRRPCAPWSEWSWIHGLAGCRPAGSPLAAGTCTWSCLRASAPSPRAGAGWTEPGPLRPYCLAGRASETGKHHNNNNNLIFIKRSFVIFHFDCALLYINIHPMQINMHTSHL